MFPLWAQRLNFVLKPLLVVIYALFLEKFLRTIWRYFLEMWLTIQLNAIWRQEHEEAEPDEIFAAIITEGQSLRRLRNATVASQLLTDHQAMDAYDELPGPSSQTLPTFHPPPIPLMPYHKRPDQVF